MEHASAYAASLVADALRIALFRRRSELGLVFHSDREPVLQPRVPAGSDRIRHAKLDEPQRELLGQCTHGKLVGGVEGRTVVRYAF